LRDRFILFVLFTVLIAGIYLYLKGIIDFSEPEIKTSKIPEIVGRNFEFTLRVEDKNSGVRDIGVYIVQKKDNEEISKTLLKEENISPASKVKEYRIKMDAVKLGLEKGKTYLIIVAGDNGLFQNIATKTISFELDPIPPELKFLHFQNYIMNGGAGFGFIKTSQDVREGGVIIGEGDEAVKFKCFSGLFKDKTVFTCTFGYPFYWRDKKPIKVYVKDIAGNITEQKVPYKLLEKKYRKTVVKLSKKFIDEKVRPLSDKDIEDPFELFRYVNVEIRRRNEEFIHKTTRNVKIIKPMYNNKFMQMRGSVSLGGFGDYRMYMLDGKIIEGADAYHKGLDLAAIKHAPVQAAENGKVVFIGDLGIYGKSIIVEHGLGVFTLYSHLYDYNVKKGQMVKRGEVIARTDTTGLAMGDHLHFGVLVQGLEVHPIEWFDKRWLDTRFYNIYQKLKLEYGEN